MEVKVAACRQLTMTVLSNVKKPFNSFVFRRLEFVNVQFMRAEYV